MTSRIWGVVAGATVLGATAGAHPAGWRPADIVLTSAFAALVTLAGAHSQRWSWLVLAGVAAVAPSGALPTAGAVAAVLVALAAVIFDSRSPIVGAVVAGLAVQALLRMHGFGFFGAPSLVAAVAVAPVLFSGYHGAPRRAQRVVVRAALAFGVVAVVCTGLAGVAGLQARNKIERAVRQAQAGFDAAQNGDREGAMAQLEAAQASFASVSDLVGAWWARPVRAVPVAGQQMAAVQVMADEGHALTRTASDGVATIDYDRLRVQGGAIDLALLGAAQRPLSDAVSALEQTSVRLHAIANGWLVPLVRDRYDRLQRQVGQTLPAVRHARDVVALGPELLGRDTPKHYVVLFGTPAETRELGGLIGNYAEVTADHGKLTLTRSGRSVELSDRDDKLGRTLQPGPYLERFAPYQVTRFFQNVSASPDFPEVADVTGQIYPQVFGQPVDGVFYMDPYALAALLNLTGPVTLETSGVTLNADNAARVLLVDQYANAQNTQERIDFLDEATRQTFEKLTSGDLPKPARVATVMSPMVDQGRLLAFSPKADVEALFRQLRLDGAFPDPHDGDFLSITQSNAGANKIDAYLKRSITYQAAYRPDTGDVASTLTVQLTNTAPADGLPDIVIANIHDRPRGTNQVVLTVYSPLSVAGAAVGGVPARVGAIDRFGLHSYSVEVDVPPGGTQTLEVKLQGVIARSFDYRLTVARQPTVMADHMEVHVQGTAGWQVAGSQQFDVASGTGSATLPEERIDELTARFAQ